MVVLKGSEGAIIGYLGFGKILGRTPSKIPLIRH